MDFDISLIKPINDTDVESIDWRFLDKDKNILDTINDVSNNWVLPTNTTQVENDTKYISVRLNIVNTVMEESDFSNPFLLSSNKAGFTFSNTILATPVVNVDFNPHQSPIKDVEFYGLPYHIITGIGNHISTDYKIEEYTTAKEFQSLVWKRFNVKDDLNRIKSKVELKPNRMYMLSMRYNIDTIPDDKRYWGSKIIKTSRII